MDNLNALKGRKINKLSTYFKPSNNPVLNKDKVNTIVLHWTGGSRTSDAVDTLRTNKLGYHFLLENVSGNINVIQGQKLSARVNHAGESYGPNGKYVNGYSYSISLVGSDNTDYKPFIDTIVNLIVDLKIINPNLKYITGHHQISPGRKIDPYTLDFSTIVSKVNEIIKNKTISTSTGVGSFGGGTINVPTQINISEPYFSYWRQGDRPYDDLQKDNGIPYYMSDITKGKVYIDKSKVTKKNEDINIFITGNFQDDTVTE